MRRKYLFIFLFSFLTCFFAAGGIAHAATLSIVQPSGTFSVGSTFTASIYLDTNGKSVNALSVSLSYPPDMLQIVSPSLGQSVIGVWTAAPKSDNVNGVFTMQGGIPGGITASNALVSTITFRVKSVGSAIVKFLDGSKVLLNDGFGTNALSGTGNAIYTLKLPPPAGPALTSDTNPDQTEWYSKSTVSFRFGTDTKGIQGYSYTLSDDPTTVPNDINLGLNSFVNYTELPDGIHFFHVKSLRDGVWGGTTHYSVKIDSTPPAEFKVGITPSSHTSDKTPVVQFATTDALSGVDHYEMKLVPLSASTSDSLFAEVSSPYVSTPLTNGNYDIILRAYDKAGNYREVTQRLVITNAVFSFVDDTGVRFGKTFVPWSWIVIVLLAIIAVAAIVGYRVRRWHFDIAFDHDQKKLPENVSKQLEELKDYQTKYGPTKALIVFLGILSLFSLSLSRASADASPLAPPVISTVSKNISNTDIFYIGGKTDTPNEIVEIYLQNLGTGATLTETVQSDANGNWFYRHSTFLSPATYRLWVQGKIDGNLSPPGPQTDMVIAPTAIQFGGNRLSYDVIYVGVILLLVAIIVVLGAYIAAHYYLGRKKRRLLQSHVQAAEESIRRGFALLRRDIEIELAELRQAGAGGTIPAGHAEKEQHLLEDLSLIEKRVGKEVWEIERTGKEPS